MPNTDFLNRGEYSLSQMQKITFSQGGATDLKAVVKRGSGCCAVDIYCTAAFDIVFRHKLHKTLTFGMAYFHLTLKNAVIFPKHSLLEVTYA